MALFTIARRRFLDRVFTVDELAAMVDMLRFWRLEKSPGCESQVHADLECCISWFPRAQREAIFNALRQRLVEPSIDTSDPDEIRIQVNSQCLLSDVDLSLWGQCLAEPMLKQACVMLRITFAGPLRSPDGSGGRGTTTVVLFGSPVDGAFLAKAIWKFDGNPVREQLLRLTDWGQQNRLLDAFEFYLQQCSIGPQASAATLASRRFFSPKSPMFTSSRASKVIVWLMRRLSELPDEHGLAAFVRRLGVPLLLAAALTTVSAATTLPLGVLVVLLAIAGICLWAAVRVFANKFSRVRQYYRGMRDGLGILHTRPVVFELSDLSNDTTPSLLKCSEELEAIGAVPVCDFKVTTARNVLDTYRQFSLGMHIVVVGVLKKFGTLEHFPGVPILRLTTHFQDGWTHGTTNHPVYRKSNLPNSSFRCLAERGGVDETVALHLRQVDRLISSGKIPSPPPSTPQQALAEHEKEHVRSDELWEKFPYSWGDALHDAFKYCRREYLRD